MDENYPAYERCPSAHEIADWFLAEKRRSQNVGGDAWWLSRNPHSACRWYAHVDRDVQEFWLLEISTDNGGVTTHDLLWITAGLDGRAVAWWQHPVTTDGMDLYWHRDGLVWMADEIVAHEEALIARHANP